jgi:rhodanese-related sulfurtransferase
VLGRDFIVFDVRDQDQFDVYHATGAVNLPSTVLLNLEDARDVVEMVRLESFRVVNRNLARETGNADGASSGVEGSEAEWPIALPKNIVFHCNLSLIRGPKSASRFLDGLNELHYRDGNSDKIVEGDFGVKVWVLEGGSKGWKGRNPGPPRTVLAA